MSKTNKFITVLLCASFSSILFSSNAFALSQVDASADVVVGQADFTHNSANQGESVGANTLGGSYGKSITDGTKMIVPDTFNNRVLIFNHIPTSNNASADVVIGQADFTHNSANQGGSVGANTLSRPGSVFYDGTRLFIADANNHRVLIFNSIPTSNDASADVVVGQADMTHGSINQGTTVDANTLRGPADVYSDGNKLFIADYNNNRVLIYDAIPTSNDASADLVVGQVDMTHNGANRGGSADANTLKGAGGVVVTGNKLLIGDTLNARVLIFNSIPTSNDASADVVIGQPDMTSASGNQGGIVADINTLRYPEMGNVSTDGERIFVSDTWNHRIVVYNSIPTSNDISADAEIGQLNFNDKLGNRSGSVGANTINVPRGVFVHEDKLIVNDSGNIRILIYNLGTRNESLSVPVDSNSRQVSLSLSAQDAKDMMISESADFSGASWESYNTSKTFTLSEGDGTKTVYAKFRDFANYEGSTVHQAINLDATAPTVSDNENLSGSTLPPGTTSKELTLTTTEDSTCKYSTNQNDSYTQMAIFSSTGGTTHSTTISDLADGTSYTYHIKCQDLLLNTRDYQISFSLASATYAPIAAVGKNKIYDLSSQETVALKVDNLFFRGKLTNLKNGKVQILEDGNLKKQEKIKKNGRWRIKIKRNHQAEQHSYQFKYFNSQKQEILVSNSYNILIDRINPRFTYLPKLIQANPGDMITWQVSDNDQIEYYQYTFRGAKNNTINNSFTLPASLPKGKSKLTVRAYDRAGNKAVRRAWIIVR